MGNDIHRMNDFVKIIDITSGSPDFSKVEEVVTYYRGVNVWTEYNIVRKHFPVKIRLNKSSGEMKIEGNFGMFWNGHNMAFPNTDFSNSIDFISTKLKTDLRGMKLAEFDHSAIVKLEQHPDAVINNHLSIPGHETKPQKAGKYFKKPRVQLVKLYNATRRMKQVYSSTMRAKIYRDCGISDKDHLLRFEKKFLHPDAYFKSRLTVDDILHPDFIDILNDDLIETYKSIMKTGLMKLPMKKKDITSATIPLIIAKEMGLIHNFNFDELVKQKIKDIPESLLTKNDKKARMRQIKANLKKISSSGTSQYDITEAISESLKMV